LLAAGCAALVLQAQAQPKKTAATPYTTWSDYGGSADSAQYSALTQINRSNVAGLQVAWTYSTGDPGNYLFNPIVVDNVMYVLAKND
jgi:quinoprotein glucose dehydrogenase